MAATPGKNTTERTKRPHTEVFPRASNKRRTTISLTQQADDDIIKLMRRTRINTPGVVIADAARLIRAMPPEFVSFMFSELDKGEDQVITTC